MFDVITEIVKFVVPLIVATICFLLSNYRFKNNTGYAVKFNDDSGKLIFRLIITEFLKWSGIILILGLIMNFIDGFIAFYIFTPIMIALNLILFDSTDWMWGFMTFVKGCYYFGLIIISAIQFFLGSKEVATLALGFTLSLAIFESITALSEGYRKMKKAEQDLFNSDIKK